MCSSKKLYFLIIIIVLALSLSIQLSYAQATGNDRSEIPEKYKWNLNDLYPTLDDW